MNARIDHLLDEALRLSTEERSALTAALIDSLDEADGASINEAWRRELRHRRDELRAGRMPVAPWGEVKGRLSAP